MKICGGALEGYPNGLGSLDPTLHYEPVTGVTLNEAAKSVGDEEYEKARRHPLMRKIERAAENSYAQDVIMIRA